MSESPWPLITGDRQELGVGALRCTTCGEPVPIGIEVWIGLDADEEECVFTEASTLDLELHLSTHGRVLMPRGGGDEDGHVP